MLNDGEVMKKLEDPNHFNKEEKEGVTIVFDIFQKMENKKKSFSI